MESLPLLWTCRKTGSNEPIFMYAGLTRFWVGFDASFFLILEDLENSIQNSFPELAEWLGSMQKQLDFVCVCE